MRLYLSCFRNTISSVPIIAMSDLGKLMYADLCFSAETVGVRAASCPPTFSN